MFTRDDDITNLQSLCTVCNSFKAGKSDNNFRLSIALKRLGPCVVYYPSLSRLIGLKESIFLCHLIYWTPKARHEKGEGWIYKSAEDFLEETGLSYKEQLRVRELLVDAGLIEEFYDRQEHVLYFRVKPETLDSLGEHIPNGHMPKSNGAASKSKVPHDQKEDATSPKVISYKEAEITTEITQRTKSGARLSKSERDSWDLRRLRVEMEKLKPQPGQRSFFTPLEQIKNASFQAGVSLSRARELLEEFWPDDEIVKELAKVQT